MAGYAVYENLNNAPGLLGELDNLEQVAGSYKDPRGFKQLYQQLRKDPANSPFVKVALEAYNDQAGSIKNDMRYDPLQPPEVAAMGLKQDLEGARRSAVRGATQAGAGALMDMTRMKQAGKMYKHGAMMDAAGARVDAAAQLTQVEKKKSWFDKLREYTDFGAKVAQAAFGGG